MRNIGIGKDRLGRGKKDGLLLEWDWWTPGEVSVICKAQLKCGRGFLIAEVARFSNGYEARIRYHGSVIIIDKDDEGEIRMTQTRAAAQKRAEDLLPTFHERLGKSLRTAGFLAS